MIEDSPFAVAVVMISVTFRLCSTMLLLVVSTCTRLATNLGELENYTTPCMFREQYCGYWQWLGLISKKQVCFLLCGRTTGVSEGDALSTCVLCIVTAKSLMVMVSVTAN